MKVFRVRRSNMAAVLALFPEAKAVSPPSRMCHGCSDPACCMQHTGFIRGEEAVGIAHAGVRGKEFHRRLVAAGILPK